MPVSGGDSRVYLVRNAAISQISKDHTEVQELLIEADQRAAEALTWPRRNVITHAVGVSDDFRYRFQQGELMPGDMTCWPLMPTAHVTDAEIEAAWCRHASGAGENLLETVLARADGQCHHCAGKD